MPLQIPIKLEIAYYRLGRMLTRPVRNIAFGRVWKRGVKVAKITGSYGKTTTCRMLANILREEGHVVGLACSEGVFVGDELSKGRSLNCYYTARRALSDSRVTAAVLECTVGGMKLHGQFLPRCDAAALLNVSSMHEGQYGLRSAQEIAETKAEIVKGSTGALVLNAQDATTAGLAEQWDPQQLIVFAQDGGSPVLAQVLERGGQVIALNSGHSHIVLRCRGEPEVRLAKVAAIPATQSGIAMHVAENAMAAAGLALALGASTASIRAGLEAPDQVLLATPLRFNVLHMDGRTIVTDKALGPGALRAGAESACKLPVKGRRIACVSAISGTNDANIAQMAKLLAGRFDELVVYPLSEAEESKAVADTLHGALAGKVDAGQLLSRSGSLEAACRMARSRTDDGDLVYVQIVVSRQFENVRRWLGAK